jgi:hypothetical protein
MFRQGRSDTCKRAACCTGIALFVTAVSAALASPARGADETVPPASATVLKIANSATIAPDVPDTADAADVSTPADEPVVPADVNSPVVTAETPANQDGWVEVKPSPPRRVAKVISVRVRVVAHSHAWRAPSTTHAAVTHRRTVQYHAPSRQYHRRGTKEGVPARTSSSVAWAQRALSRAKDEPSGGQQSGDGICPSEPSICPDVCSDDSTQNSLQNVAEIVRCIVNSALAEIGNTEAGSAPDSGVATPAPPAPSGEPDTGGQYQCEDVRYHDPACESAPPGDSPAAPPTSAPTPDAAPVEPPSGTTVVPPASGSAAAPVGVATPSNPDGGWELVNEQPEQRPVAHVIAAAPRVRPTRVLQTTHTTGVTHVRPPSRVAVHTRRQSPSPEERPRVVALGPAAGASSSSDTGEWPLPTTVVLLALASIVLALGALAKVYGGGTAVGLRTRLSSKGLSAAHRRRPDDERGIRYRG